MSSIFVVRNVADSRDDNTIIHSVHIGECVWEDKLRESNMIFGVQHNFFWKSNCEITREIIRMVIERRIREKSYVEVFFHDAAAVVVAVVK